MAFCGSFVGAVCAFLYGRRVVATVLQNVEDKRGVPVSNTSSCAVVVVASCDTVLLFLLFSHLPIT